MAARLPHDQKVVSSNPAGSYETAPLSGNCNASFPHVAINNYDGPMVEWRRFELAPRLNGRRLFIRNGRTEVTPKINKGTFEDARQCGFYIICMLNWKIIMKRAPNGANIKKKCFFLVSHFSMNRRNQTKRLLLLSNKYSHHLNTELSKTGFIQKLKWLFFQCIKKPVCILPFVNLIFQSISGMVSHMKRPIIWIQNSKCLVFKWFAAIFFLAALDGLYVAPS